MEPSFIFFLVSCGFALYVGRARYAHPVALLGYYSLLYIALKYAYNSSIGASFLMGYTGNSFNRLFYIQGFCMLFLAGGALVFNHKRIDPAIMKLDIRDGGSVSRFGIFMGIAAPIGTLLVVVAIGRVNIFNDPVGFRAFIQSNGRFYLLAVIMFASSLWFVELIDSVVLKKRLPALWIWLSAPGLFTFNLLCGLSSAVFQNVVVALVYLSITRRWRIEILAITLFPLLVVFAYVHNAYRQAKSGDPSISFADVAVERLTSSQFYADLFNRLDYLEVANLAQEEVLDRDLRRPFNHVASLVQPIPRAFWPEKPLNFSAFMARTVQPENFERGVTANYHYTTELLLPFGYFGVPVGIVFVGVLVWVSVAAYNSAVANNCAAKLYSICIVAFLGQSYLGGFINEVGPQILIIDVLLFKLCYKSATVSATAGGVRRGEKLMIASVQSPMARRRFTPASLAR